MVTKAGEIELDVRLTGDDISKTLHKISDSITKKFDSAFSSLSKDFENVSTDMKQSFSKVAEGVSQKTEKEFSNIKGSGEQLSNSVSSSFKKIGMAVVAAFSVAKICKSCFFKQSAQVWCAIILHIDRLHQRCAKVGLHCAKNCSMLKTQKGSWV